jgi:chromosome partitioning protein
MRIIGLVTQKGGTGKSTLTTALAVAAVEAGETVIILDLDEQGTVAEWANVREKPEPTVAHVPPAQAARLPEALKAAAKKYTVAFIDTPGQDSPVTHNVMSAADICLVPLRPTRPDGLGVKRTIEALIRGHRRFAFVLNQCPTTPGSTRPQEMAAGLGQLGYMAQPMIFQRVDFQDAYAAGQGVTEYAPTGKAAQEIRQLWQWVNRETRGKSGDAIPAQQIGAA